MSGTWLVRKGVTFLPLQFVSSKVPGGDFTSMGLWTEAASFNAEQVVSDVGGVSATAASPARLKLPKHLWARSYGAIVPLIGSMLVQITTMLEIDAPHATASFEAGGGPGNFTWCPGNPACAAGGLPPGYPAGTGRIVYVAGANRFGGTMQLGLRGGGLIALKGLGGPFAGAVGHVPLVGSGSAPRRLAVGGGANDVPSIEVLKLAPGVLTAPIGGIPPSGQLITMPGPVVGMLPSLTTPMGGMTGQLTTSWGFPHTTGTVIVQQNTGSNPGSFFTIMGSDARTPLGAGNLSTVAGGLAKWNTASGASGYGMFDRVSLTLGPPVPSLSPAAFAAASALILLAAGYALRRRRA